MPLNNKPFLLNINNRPSIKWLFTVLGLSRAETQTSIAEREALTKYANKKMCLAEIGVYQGVTMKLLLQAMDPCGMYFAVDPYPGGRLGIDFSYLIARHEVSGVMERKQIFWIKEKGCDAVSDSRVVNCKFDFLFIDGDHSYDGIKGDWTSWRDRIEVGGIVAFHDVVGTGYGCQVYFDSVICKDDEFKILDNVESTVILERVDL